MGQYNRGYKHGRGKYYFKKKYAVYEGDWDRNTYKGNGKMTWYPNFQALEQGDDSNAAYYQGQWHGNKMHGSGTYYWPEKKQRFEGNYYIA